jgi:hypothetical protein
MTVPTGKHIYKPLTAILVFVFLIGCQRRADFNLIPEDQYIKVAAELQFTRAYLQVSKDTIAYMTLNDAILKKYGYSAAQFDSTHHFYEKDYEAQLKRYQKVREYVKYIENGPLKLVNPVLTPNTDSVFNARKLSLE